MLGLVNYNILDILNQTFKTKITLLLMLHTILFMHLT